MDFHLKAECQTRRFDVVMRFLSVMKQQSVRRTFIYFPTGSLTNTSARDQGEVGIFVIVPINKLARIRRISERQAAEFQCFIGLPVKLTGKWSVHLSHIA